MSFGPPLKIVCLKCGNPILAKIQFKKNNDRLQNYMSFTVHKTKPNQMEMNKSKFNSPLNLSTEINNDNMIPYILQ